MYAVKFSIDIYSKYISILKARMKFKIKTPLFPSIFYFSEKTIAAKTYFRLSVSPPAAKKKKTLCASKLDGSDTQNSDQSTQMSKSILSLSPATSQDSV